MKCVSPIYMLHTTANTLQRQISQEIKKVNILWFHRIKMKIMSKVAHICHIPQHFATWWPSSCKQFSKTARLSLRRHFWAYTLRKNRLAKWLFLNLIKHFSWSGRSPLGVLQYTYVYYRMVDLFLFFHRNKRVFWGTDSSCIVYRTKKGFTRFLLLILEIT